MNLENLVMNFRGDYYKDIKLRDLAMPGWVARVYIDWVDRYDERTELNIKLVEPYILDRSYPGENYLEFRIVDKDKISITNISEEKIKLNGDSGSVSLDPGRDLLIYSEEYYYGQGLSEAYIPSLDKTISFEIVDRAKRELKMEDIGARLFDAVVGREIKQIESKLKEIQMPEKEQRVQRINPEQKKTQIPKRDTGYTIIVIPTVENELDKGIASRNKNESLCSKVKNLLEKIPIGIENFITSNYFKLPMAIAAGYILLRVCDSTILRTLENETMSWWDEAITKNNVFLSQNPIKVAKLSAMYAVSFIPYVLVPIIGATATYALLEAGISGGNYAKARFKKYKKELAYLTLACSLFTCSGLAGVKYYQADRYLHNKPPVFRSLDFEFPRLDNKQGNNQKQKRN